MKDKEIFDILENAEYESMERLIDKCPEIPDEQLDRILAMSEKKFRDKMAAQERTERDNTIKMTENDEVQGVERSRRPAWLAYLTTAASVILIAGIAIGSTFMLRRESKPGGGGELPPAVTATTTASDNTGTTFVSSGKDGTVTVTTTTTTAGGTAVTSAVPGGEGNTVTAAENEELKPFVGRWKYQASSGNYTVDMGAENIGTVEIRGDGTYTYTENNGNVTTDRVERSVEKIAGTEFVTLTFYDGSAIKFVASYNEAGSDRLNIGNGGLERLVREGSADANVPEVKSSWKTAYRQVLNDFMNSSEYTQDTRWDVQDLDSDGTPELLISLGTFYAAGVRIYYYENGNAVPVLTGDGSIGAYGLYGELKYCPGEYLLGGYNLNKGYEYYSTAKYEGHKVTPLQTTMNNVGIVGEDAAEYYINEIEVSKEEHDDAVAQWNVKNWVSAGRQYTFGDFSPLS
ncbi:hypothetical protein [Ruminococcus flavefaciens]|uniref:hypothetical protein n=1 Tax=Ruminococcus flavefaciens TaxID=1265 RepID=UPI00048A4804|nr:hypothetical protein [Ruminococcus flavefaciens]